MDSYSNNFLVNGGGNLSPSQSSLSNSQIRQKAFQQFKRAWKSLLLANVLAGLPFAVIQLIVMTLLTRTSFRPSMLLFAVLMLVMIFGMAAVWYWFSYCLLITVRQNKLAVLDIFYLPERCFTAVIALSLFWLLILIGSFLLLIPGIIAHLMFSLTPYIILDNNNVGIFSSLNNSRLMMKGHKWQLFILLFSYSLPIFGMQLILMICGAIVPVIFPILFIGMYVLFFCLTWLIQLALANFYEQLKSQQG